MDARERGNGRASVSEQRLHDSLDEMRDEQRREHLRTRAWVVLLTAPSWGAVVGGALGVPSLATVLASAAGAGLFVAAKLGFLLR